MAPDRTGSISTTPIFFVFGDQTCSDRLGVVQLSSDLFHLIRLLER
jgi:hypothetical protein